MIIEVKGGQRLVTLNTMPSTSENKANLFKTVPCVPSV